MVSHIRFRAVLLSLAFWALAGGASFYFIWSASNGDRGLGAKHALKARIPELQAELAALKGERAGLDHRLTLMRGDAIDRDMLDEQVHASLDWAAKADMVIILPRPQGQR